VFAELVHELAEQVPLGKLFCIDGTDIPVDQRDEDADWNYDHAEDDYYYGYGCCVTTAAYNIPVAAAFTPAKKADEDTAMRVTGDALAVDTPRWFLGDAGFDMLEWHDWLLEQSVVPVSAYNQRNTSDPPDIECRIEKRSKNTAIRFVSGSANLTRRTQNAHVLKQQLVSVRISASGPRGSEAEYASNHTSPLLCASE
jgi:hypothetical protein